MVNLPYGQWYRNAEQIIDQLAQDRQLPPIKERGLKARLKMVKDQLVDRPRSSWTNWYDDDFSRFSCLSKRGKSTSESRFPLSSVLTAMVLMILGRSIIPMNSIELYATGIRLVAFQLRAVLENL